MIERILIAMLSACMVGFIVGMVVEMLSWSF